MSRSGDVPLFPEEAVRAGARWWEAQGAVVTVLDRPGNDYDVIIDVEPDGATGFQIRRDSTGRALTTDGTSQQTAFVASWARSLVPPEEPTEVWLVDDDYTQHVVLTPGITADEVGRSWTPIES